MEVLAGWWVGPSDFPLEHRLRQMTPRMALCGVKGDAWSLVDIVDESRHCILCIALDSSIHFGNLAE